MKDPLYFLVQKLLLSNGIYIDQEELELQISSHPSYPSMHAITGVLNHFGIDNMAVEVPVSKDIVTELPKTFIAHWQLENKQDDFVLVELKGQQAKITTGDYKKEKVTIDEFLSRWKGILVLVEKNDYKTAQKPNTWHYVPLLLLGLLTSYSLYQAKGDFIAYIYLFLMAVGVYVSFLISKHELGFHSKSIDAVCTGSEKTSCDAVLNSDGALLFGLFKMSDISLVYFLTLFIAGALLILTANTFISSLIFLGLSAIPVVLYSLYYQKFVVKKWCPLCLATVTVLCCQIALVFLLNPRTFIFNGVGLLIVAATALVVIASYGFIKPLLLSQQKLRQQYKDGLKFKRKYTIFNSLYQDSTYQDTTLANAEIHFGNPDTALKLVLVTNPLCGHCKPKHQQVARLLKKHSEAVLVTIRFNISVQNKENPSYQIANILLNLYQENQDLCFEAMHEIYADGSKPERWLAKYKTYNTKDNETIMDTSQQWCEANQINFTPAVYLNNKQYPKEYELDDMALFIEELTEAVMRKGKASILV